VLSFVFFAVRLGLWSLSAFGALSPHL
jgi:hypothetical protein